MPAPVPRAGRAARTVQTTPAKIIPPSARHCRVRSRYTPKSPGSTLKAAANPSSAPARNLFSPRASQKNAAATGKSTSMSDSHRAITSSASGASRMNDEREAPNRPCALPGATAAPPPSAHALQHQAAASAKTKLTVKNSALPANGIAHSTANGKNAMPKNGG